MGEYNEAELKYFIPTLKLIKTIILQPENPFKTHNTFTNFSGVLDSILYDIFYTSSNVDSLSRMTHNFSYLLPVPFLVEEVFSL